MNFNSTIEAAQILWDYMRLNQLIEKADAIIALGSSDMDTARYSAELYHQGYAPVIVMSGGVSPNWQNAEFDGMTEAEVYKKLALQDNVPEKNILVENRATNTSENLWFSEQLLKDNGFKTDRIILIQHPSSERRVLATATHRWDDKQVYVTARPDTLQKYGQFIGMDKMIASMVGDFQRLETYRNIHLADEKITDLQWSAFDYLARNGYTQFLMEPFTDTLKRVNYA